MNPSQEEVREWFDYHPDGYLVWKQDSGTNKLIGRRYGWNCKGYKRGDWRGRTYPEHRLIFLWHHGFIPEHVDHIDRDPGNNKVENLREVSVYQQIQNQGIRTDTNTGLKGVSYHEAKGNYRVYIQAFGIKAYLGSYKSPVQAAAVYNQFAEKLHGEFAVLNDLSKAS